MRLLHRQLINPTVTTVQSCILIAHYFGGEGDVKSKNIYIGIARLHSQAIHLWETLEDSDIITGEIRRRTWLSVVIAEKWSAADMSIQSVIYEDHGSIFPSLDEIEFLAI
jgi:Fungal specific transcription factor domain